MCRFFCLLFFSIKVNSHSKLIYVRVIFIKASFHLPFWRMIFKATAKLENSNTPEEKHLICCCCSRNGSPEVVFVYSKFGLGVCFRNEERLYFLEWRSRSSWLCFLNDRSSWNILGSRRGFSKTTTHAGKMCRLYKTYVIVFKILAGKLIWWIMIDTLFCFCRINVYLSKLNTKLAIFVLPLPPHYSSKRTAPIYWKE